MHALLTDARACTVKDTATTRSDYNGEVRQKHLIRPLFYDIMTPQLEHTGTSLQVVGATNTLIIRR